MNALAHKFDSYLTPHEQVQFFEIAHQMRKERLPDEFIASSIKFAFEFDGIADLLKLWSKEADINERNEIIADIQELINDCSESEGQEFTLIKLNDLEAIAKDIRMFKDSLLTLVNEYGGITKLAELTQIPQPSLSRFFNSNAMPRRTTLLKIASALKLDAVKVTTPWAR